MAPSQLAIPLRDGREDQLVAPRMLRSSFHVRLFGTGLFRRAHEVAEVHSPHSHVIHARSMVVRRPQPRPETTLVSEP